MDFKKNRITKTGVLLCLSIVMVCTTVMSAQGEILSAGQLVRWQLTDTRIIDEGQTATTDDGILVDRYIIEATAVAIGDAPVPAGVFQLTTSVFQPVVDMPGQKVGAWYMKGVWTITALNTSPKTLEVKHNNARVKGFFTAELPFDPTMETGNIQGEIQWPLTLIGTHWAQGEGVFNGSSRFEGQLEMVLLRWQEVY